MWSLSAWRRRRLLAKQSVLDSYQAKANAALDQAIGWPKPRPLR